MNKTLKVIAGLGLMSLAVRTQADETVVEIPMAVGALHEFGYVTKGLYRAGTENAEFHGEWIDHFGAFMTKEAVVDGRLHLSGGLGGVFQFRKPETVGPSFDFHQRKGFFIGPTRAEAIYDFGNSEAPWLKLGVGMFPYKYNPDAWNLGENLFRAGPYPTFTTTGGYVLVNSAAANLQGLKANFKFGNLKADVLFTTETGLAPFYDLSIAGVISYTVGGGLLDLGAGINCKRIIPVRPSRTSRKEIENSYFNVLGKDYVGSKSYYTNQSDFIKTEANMAYALATAADSARGDVYRAIYVTDSTSDSITVALIDTVFAWKDRGDPRAPDIKYFTSTGILVMARASLDLKKILSVSSFGPEDLKLYFEVNVLGIQNYPVFYEKMSERSPIMVGFNVPCFKILDLLAVQAEYLKSPWLNNTFNIGRAGNNVPFSPGGSDIKLSQIEYNDQTKKDNLKWSILAKKNIGHLSILAQVASDHLRLPSSRYYYGPQFDHNEVTAFKNSWYWMTQLAWGI